jgi:alcohol dehydrogenase class IV
MDALVHCVETYLATAWNPPADGMALEGVRRAGRWLRRAVEQDRDVEARREMLAVALNGALAGQKGLGAVHALAHALEAELSACGSAAVGAARMHGALHAALLPPVLRFNAPAVGERYATLAWALGEGGSSGQAVALSELLAGLGRQIGLPSGLDGIGFSPEALERAAAAAAEDAANRTNPRHATPPDYRAMLAEAC